MKDVENGRKQHETWWRLPREASTLRYARHYSALQNTSGSHASQLSSQVRDLQRRVDSLRHAFEKALGGDEHSIAWTRESLQGSVHCQPKANARLGALKQHLNARFISFFFYMFNTF